MNDLSIAKQAVKVLVQRYWKDKGSALKTQRDFFSKSPARSSPVWSGESE